MKRSAEFSVTLNNGKRVTVVMAYEDLSKPGFVDGGYPFDNGGFLLWAKQNGSFTDINSLERFQFFTCPTHFLENNLKT